MTRFTLHTGDSLNVMRELEADSIDSIVTDPPYGLSFMGKDWDHGVPGVPFWEAALRVAKPGAFLLAFGGTRTFHRLAVAIEDAGWEIRDTIMWVYGSGFPKSLDVGKAIDKRGGVTADFSEFRDAVKAAMKQNGVSRAQLQDALGNFMLSHYLTAGSQPAIPNWRDYGIIRDTVGLGDAFDHLFESEAEREVVGIKTSGIANKQAGPRHTIGASQAVEVNITAPATDAARQWHGWGTALKPAWEPILIARKPLAGTVAENVLKYGTGALNIDASRIPFGEGPTGVWGATQNAASSFVLHTGTPTTQHANGRWPANLIHDGSDEVMKLFPEATVNKPGRMSRKESSGYEGGWGDRTPFGYDVTGSAARFFYCAKASRADRNSGLDSIEIVTAQCSSWGNADHKARLRVDTAHSRPRVIGVSGAPCNDATVWNTFLFGNDTTDKCQPSSKFTIETATSSTTESKTLNWLIRSNTSECTADANSTTAIGGSHAASAEPNTPCLTTTSEWTVSHRGVERAASRTRWIINGNAGQPSDHPTVKPTSLMRYLCRLVTQPNGLVLDPFMGSGSTGKAAILEGYRFVGIDLNPEYVQIAHDRITHALDTTPLFNDPQ